MNEYDPLEKLALLQAHAIDWRRIPSSYQHLTQMDIAGMLAGIPRGAALLVRVKYADQTSLMRDLVRELRAEVVRRRIPWPTKKKTRLKALAELALREVIDAKVCRECGGAGYFPEVRDDKPTGRQEACPKCEGGRRRYTDHYRYTKVGIHQEEWRRHWSRVYTEILTIPWEWEHKAREALKR